MDHREFVNQGKRVRKPIVGKRNWFLFSRNIVGNQHSDAFCSFTVFLFVACILQLYNIALHQASLVISQSKHVQEELCFKIEGNINSLAFYSVTYFFYFCNLDSKFSSVVEHIKAFFVMKFYIS